MPPVSLPNAQLRLADSFAAVRAQTEAICRPLELEDHVVQPAPFVSPPKWHLAHTTWFFDCFLLNNAFSHHPDAAQSRGFLFNSYYKSLGEHWPQARRGHLSRPTVREIHSYRLAVTEALLLRIERQDLDAHEYNLVMLGIHHEQQHQELLFMDIKYILGMHPQMPAYMAATAPDTDSATLHESPRWLSFGAGLRQIGHEESQGFGFDNESPRHRLWSNGFQLRNQLVRNGEYRDFIRDGGYQRPELWLSDGWDWVRSNHIKAPLYWRQQAEAASPEDDWFEYHLHGLEVLDPALPIAHVNYYEAAAYAAWAGARLPTEAELEIAADQYANDGNASATAFWTPGQALMPSSARAVDGLENGLLWQWTRSSYEAYPGYQPTLGALGEYNGKFMSGQRVLRGGCIATPAHHWRTTYRNFYRPEDRWCFSGIRLAKDES
jgi:ergothioneine biosynthesis protein EgtB